MRWDVFEETAPELARIARERFARDQLVMLGTLRRDGSPRISPCEVDLAVGHLFLGMMWRSPKALDLARDPRLVVHSVTCNREGTDGDVKLYGRAVDVQESPLRHAYREAIRARIDWEPEEPNYHLFSLEVEGSAFVRFSGGTEEIWTWDPGRGLRTRTRVP